MEAKAAPKPKPPLTEEIEEATSVQEERTPVRPGKGVKRKNTSPTPSGTTTTTTSPAAGTANAVFVTPSKDRDDGKPSSAKKRRKSASSSLALSKVGSPSTSFNPAAMTERQQMAYLLQMTGPQKKAEEPPTPVKEVQQVTPGRVHKRNERGETPLHIACIRGDLRMAASLIEQGADVNATDHAGWTPLHEACNHGHTEVVSLLLGHGAGVNTRGMDGDTPLHDATINNHAQVVKLLLEHGSDPNLANEREQTSLDVCPNEEIRQILTNTTAKTGLSTSNGNEIAVPNAHSDRQSAPVHIEREQKEKQESTEEEEKESEEDSAFLPEPHTVPLQSALYHKTTSAQSTVSATISIQSTASTATSEDTTRQLPEVTPSRSRRRLKRERGFALKGKGVGDVSSSESDSELLVTARKVPRLVDRLPAVLREESDGVDERISMGVTGTVEDKEVVGGESEGELMKANSGGDVEVEEKEENKKLDDDSTGASKAFAGEIEQWPDGVEGVRKEEEDEEEVVGEREGHEVLDVTEGVNVEDQDEEDGKVLTGPKIEGNLVDPGKEMGELASKAAESAEEKRELPSCEPPHPVSGVASDKQDLTTEQHDTRLDTETPQPSSEQEYAGQSEREVGEGEPESADKEEMSRNHTEPQDQSLRVPISVDIEGSSVAVSDGGRRLEGGREEKEGGGLGEDDKCGEVGVEDGESVEEPTQLICSIPFYHVKLKRGRGKSPMRLVRTSSKDRVPHETSMLRVQHGKVESVSSILRDSVKTESGVLVKTVERLDTVSSLETRASSRMMTEKYVKHGGRKVLPVSKKTAVKEGRGGERVGSGGDGKSVLEGERHEWSSEGVVLGTGLGWESMPPYTGSGSAVGRGASSARYSIRDSGKPGILCAGSRDGGLILGRGGEEPASPTPTHSRDSDEDDDVEEQSDDSDSSRGTVVSLSTSLPIIFSGLQSQTPKPSPLANTGSSSTVTAYSEATTSTSVASAITATAAAASGSSSSGGTGRGDSLTVSQQPTAAKVLPAVSLTPGDRITSGVKRPASVPGPAKDCMAEVDESIPLPPKFSYRPVLRSAVVQQRREAAGRPPASSHLPSFLMSTQHSRQPQQPTSPKVVYPPIHSAMYKLFSEHEAERVQLRSAHFTQQDRLLLCMEQELVRAHQRASRQCSTISVCAVLLERLLPRAEAAGEDRPLGEHNGDISEGEQSVDERLLSSLVQDVWDKFCNQRSLLLTRQRHEAEAMWMLQHQQWTDRLRDLGFTHQMNFLTMHVPKLFC